MCPPDFAQAGVALRAGLIEKWGRGTNRVIEMCRTAGVRPLAFEEVARRALHADGGTGLAAFASFSAAQWLAPYGRTGTQYFYANDTGLERLRSALKLSSIAKGENVLVTVLKDSGLLRDTVEPAPGAICTSPVQTYLDLALAGERGREASEHLRHERLTWPK